MTQSWALPGYDVQSLLGYGSTGEVWRAREVATGEPVALKRLRQDADPAAVAALRREASLLRSLDTPYVVRVREVVGEGQRTVLVLDLAAGGSLAALLARRGRLDPGEVVTIAGPLAQALAVAHAGGMVHGDVSPSNVLFTGEGMPLLADFGVARIAGEQPARVDGTAEYVDPAVAAGGQPDAASDVWALAAVCHHMLSGTPPHDGEAPGDVLAAARAGARAPLGLLAPMAPRPLVEAVESALQSDPAGRPDAAAFAGALRRSHAAAPVRLTSGRVGAPAAALRATHAVHSASVPGAPRAPSVRRLSRPIGLAVAGVLALGMAAAAGWWSGRGTPAGPAELARVAARPTGPPALPSWAAVLDGLDARRAAAFAAADARLLAAVYAPQAPGLAADAAAIARLRAAEQTARGVRHALRHVEQVAYDGRLARLRIRDVLSSYEVLDRAGRVTQRSAPRGELSFVVELVKLPQGWRLRGVRRG